MVFGWIVAAVAVVAKVVDTVLGIRRQIRNVNSAPILPNPVLQEIEGNAKIEADRAREEAAAARKAQEEAERIAQELRYEAERTRQAAEALKRKVEEAQAVADRSAREQAENVKVAEAEAERAKNARLAAEKLLREKEDDAVKARAAQAEVERQWKAGIQPHVLPTLEEIRKVKKELQYTEGMFHFAVAGVAGSGKSSLINAIRGLRNNARGKDVAATGAIETTTEITRYPDPDPARSRFVWYDVPGAGTLNVPDWQYFNSQGLYIFDCIIVLVGDRFTKIDIAIIRSCEKLGIPFYIVRSKSDQHIRNIMEDMPEESDDEDGTNQQSHKRYQIARETYINASRDNVRRQCEKADLKPGEGVYLVSKEPLRHIIQSTNIARIRGMAEEGMYIDESTLLDKLFTTQRNRRILVTEE